MHMNLDTRKMTWTGQSLNYEIKKRWLQKKQQQPEATTASAWSLQRNPLLKEQAVVRRRWTSPMVNEVEGSTKRLIEHFYLLVSIWLNKNKHFSRNLTVI